MADEVVTVVKAELEDNVSQGFKDMADAASASFDKIAADSEKLNAATDKVVDNVIDIGRAFKEGFGEGAANAIRPITEALNKLTGGSLSAIGKSFSGVATAIKAVVPAAAAARSNISALVATFTSSAAAAQAMGGSTGLLAGILGELIPVAGLAGVAIGGIATIAVAVGAGLLALASSAAASVNELRHAAEAAGTTVQTFEQLSFALKQAGANANALPTAFAAISNATQTALAAGEKTTASFARLGISLVDAGGHARDVGAIFLDVADKIGKIKNPADQAAAVIDLFGARIGRQLVGALSKGGEGLRTFIADMESLGGTTSDASVQIAADFENATGRMGFAWDKFKEKVGERFEPFFTGFFNTLADGLGFLNQAMSETTTKATEAKEAVKGLGLTADDVRKLQAAANGITFAGLVEEAKAAFESIKSGAGDAASFLIGTFARAFLNIIPGVGPIVAFFSAIKSNASGATASLDTLGKAADGVTQHFKTSDEAMAALGKRQISVLDGVFGAAQKTNDAAQQSARGIEAVGSSLSGVTDAAARTADGVKGVADQLSNIGQQVSFQDINTKAQTSFTQLVTDATATADQLATALNTGLQTLNLQGFVDLVRTELGSLVGTATELGASIGSALMAALGAQTDFSAFTSAVQLAIDGMISMFSSIDFSGAFTGFITAAQAQFDQLPAIVQTAVANLPALFAPVAQAIGSVFTAAVGLASAAMQALGLSATQAGSTTSTSMGTAKGAVDSLATAANNAATAFRAMETAARAAATAAANANAQAAGGRARGGPVFGPGTGTSDSIPAWLSSGEWVIRAAAVRKYGHGLFHALNSMKLPSNVLRRLIRGFADGGLVSMPSLRTAPLRMAAGGSVGSTQTINLSIGGQKFEGLIAPADVADKLIRYSLNEQVRSGGRKPGWYR